MTAPFDLGSFVPPVPDFPQPGITFRDITPLLADAQAFDHAINELEVLSSQFTLGNRIDKIACMDARGFIFGAALARSLACGLVLLRKPGKLPRAAAQVSYGLEYGQSTLCMHLDSIKRGERVLIVDDVLATGGTATAAYTLLREAGALVLGGVFLIELKGLLQEGLPYGYASVLSYG